MHIPVSYLLFGFSVEGLPHYYNILGVFCVLAPITTDRCRQLKHSMASCRGVACRGNVSPKTLIRNPLATEETRERLRQFFEDCDLESALDELTFWEMCSLVIAKSNNFSSGWLSRLRGAGYRRRDLMKDVQELAHFAQERNINLDLGQLAELEQAAKSARLPETIKVVETCRRLAEVLLEPKLEAFRKEMKRQHNMV